ncbi:hypothetical protein DAPPUDRAFT_324310 [Daphnia pulex]|uniref:Uncharacterized protein n=1 Tax=Daphnia pulex TaxID=6669 RepID=E9H1I6_DAPPU|nr:hypothetical protein DAPPUDRAFT_324310 [Daphnia pulex]|eukprot:EFX74362.1 hypothetical protein DAPPUDRAFT_324310 [Daphnia pulex]
MSYSSFNIQQVLLILAAVLLLVAQVTRDVAATSYDKYDPGFGIYDDGFSNDNGGYYDVSHGYYQHRMGQASNNYAIKHNYGSRLIGVAAGPIHRPARAPAKIQPGVYGRVPQMPGQYYSMGFY